MAKVSQDLDLTDRNVLQIRVQAVQDENVIDVQLVHDDLVVIRAVIVIENVNKEHHETDDLEDVAQVRMKMSTVQAARDEISKQISPLGGYMRLEVDVVYVADEEMVAVAVVLVANHV